MSATINSIGSGPVTGMRLGFVVSTGDIADSCQLNELRWQIDILDGGHEIVADSGRKGTWEGVQGNDPDWYDVHYWHPDGTPAGKPVDLPKATWGYPTVQGLIAAATRPFTSRGIGMPWYVTFGNHDGEIQGNIASNLPNLREIAVGDQKVWDPPAGMSAVSFLASFIATGKIPDGTRIRTVTADPARQVLTHKQFIQAHFTTTGSPVGHGFTQASIDSDTGYYAFNPVPQIRAIALDTVNPNGGADGSLDATQFSWLKDQLDAARTDKKLVIVFSHHTITTMENGKLADPKTQKPRVTGDQVRELLLAYPNVIAWVNGHTHDNNIWARPRSGGNGGFWEVNTASHIDWPSQSRLVEVVDNQDGTLSIFTTILDFAAPVPDYSNLDSPAAIAAVARELAANDWQDRTGYTATVDGRRGAATDRNTELLIAKPTGV
jgi:metallophosphoesterase (TIGR03767 family)